MAIKQLSTAEIRKLIKVHNTLVTIKIPPKSSRAQILALIDSRGYQVNHKSKTLEPKTGTSKTVKKKTIPLNLADQAIAKTKVVKTELQKQKAIEKKEVKALEKKKAERELKKTAVALATKTPAKKAPPTKKVKQSKKEDEVRRARQPAPPIPRAKDFVKIGGRPAGKKVEVGTLNKGKLIEKKPAVKKVRVRKTKEERETNKAKITDFNVRRELVSRVKKISELKDAIDQYNMLETTTKKLRTKNESRGSLIDKIVTYGIDKMDFLDIPDRVARPRLTAEQKATKKESDRVSGKTERDRQKPYNKLRKFVGSLFTKYNQLLRDNKYKDVRDLKKQMNTEYKDAEDELAESLEEKDIEVDEEILEELDNQVDGYGKQLTDIAERGLKGEFEPAFKKQKAEEERARRDGVPKKEAPKKEAPKKEAPKKAVPKKEAPNKDKIITVFKDIITGMRETIEPLLSDSSEPDKDTIKTLKPRLKALKTIMDKLNKNIMTGWTPKQKDEIGKAIFIYLDRILSGGEIEDLTEDDPVRELEPQINIARELQKKYPA